jgi:hypothetical protein
MRSLLPVVLIVTAALGCVASARAQAPNLPQGSGTGPLFQEPRPNQTPTAEEELIGMQKGVERLQTELAARLGEQKDDDLKKQVELLQKQIETQQKMIQLLVDHVRKQPLAGSPVEKLQTQTATLESRSQQAARRDEEMGRALDILTEHLDADERNGPRLPETLKELFLPSRTNETPLSIYAHLVDGFQQFNGKPGVFASPDMAPFFLLQLNDQFLLEFDFDINNAAGLAGVTSAQADWIVTDWLTVVAGRYITPIGFFNERISHEWINRLPDVPLMFRQVSPLTSTDGIQLRGATYLGGSPVKLEYSLYGGNGLQAAAPPAGLNDVANLATITGGSDETSLKAGGGRIGFWVPEWGLTGGISTYFNGPYSTAAPDQFNLWQLDFGYHKGNWDVRFEYAENYQQAASYIGNNIRRTGFYAQVAYRPYQLANCILRNLEVAARYSRVWFHGIDPTMLDPATFATPVDVPVDRDQWTVGVNYYFYPSMALRLAYEINHEFNGINLHDNVFLAQYVWAF